MLEASPLRPYDHAVVPGLHQSEEDLPLRSRREDMRLYLQGGREGGGVHHRHWRLAPPHDESGEIHEAKSRLFALELDEVTAPWAYHMGEPCKAISALELLTMTIGISVFAADLLWVEDADGLVRVTGQTDSQVSANVVSRGMTTSFPLCCVAMELASRLESARLHLDLDWVPCELNQEADDLLNRIVGGFSPQLRIQLDLSKFERRVLGRLTAEGAEYFAAIAAARQTRGRA